MRPRILVLGVLAMTAGSAVTTSAAPAAPCPPAPLHWLVATLPAPAAGAPLSYAEPGIAIAADGTALVDAASANTGAPPTLWMSHDGGATWTSGRDFDSTGASTGDADVAIGNDGYLYSLNLAYNSTPPAQPTNPTVLVYRSRDGRSWLGPATFPAPHGLDQPDRPWVIVDPHTPADVDVVNSEGGGNIVMWRSVDHGASFAGPVPMTGGVNGQAALALGSRPLFDSHDSGRIYMLYETLSPAGVVTTAGDGSPINEFPMTQLWLTTSTDAGLTWSNHQVLETAALSGSPLQGGTLAHLLVASAIDAAGNIYAAFSLRPNTSTATHVYLIHSTDHGATWTPPVQVGSTTNSNVMPAVAASGDGVVYLSWYGSAAADFRDAAARWVEMFAMSSDPLSSRPTFVVGQVSGAQPVHVGGIDTAGAIGSDLGDNWGLRDFQSIAVDACGRPHLVWAVDAGRRTTEIAAPLPLCNARGITGVAGQARQSWCVAGSTTVSGAPAPVVPPQATPNTGTAPRAGTAGIGAVLVVGALARAMRRRRDRRRTGPT